METKRINSPDTGFTDAFLKHAFTPQNVGVISDPDGFGAPRGVCGDIIEIGLRIREGAIDDIKFITDGCLHTVACGSVVTTLAKGRRVDQALALGPEQIVESLGGLPREHMHCANLAATTLRLAVKDYLKHRSAPWKKLYSRAGGGSPSPASGMD